MWKTLVISFVRSCKANLFQQNQSGVIELLDDQVSLEGRKLRAVDRVRGKQLWGKRSVRSKMGSSVEQFSKVSFTRVDLELRYVYGKLECVQVLRQIQIVKLRGI